MDFATRRRMIELRKLASHAILPPFDPQLVDSWGEQGLTQPSILERSLSRRLQEDSLEYDGTLDPSKYQQRSVDGIHDFEAFHDRFPNAHEPRFAVIEPNCSVPMHIDSPLWLNIIVLCKGTNRVVFDDASIDMKAGMVLLVNSSHNHAIYNTSDEPRVAILLKGPVDEYSQYLR